MGNNLFGFVDGECETEAPSEKAFVESVLEKIQVRLNVTKAKISVLQWKLGEYPPQ